MFSWIHLYFFIGLAGLALSLCLTPFFQYIAERTDFMDRPRGEAHKGHGKATPLLGGAAMFTAWILCIGGGILLVKNNHLPQMAALLSAHSRGIDAVGNQLAWLVFGAFLAMLLGLVDDRWAMKAYVKFFGQFCIALIAVFGGGARLSFFCPWPRMGAVVSIFWFMLMMNAINFFDNMDGLAVGTITIAMALFAVVAGFFEQYFVASLAALSCGVGAGFWFFNHNPATIFMGDSGSHFLGYLAASVSCLVTYFRLDQSLSRFPILLPLFILAIPLFDTLMVVIIRWRNHKPFWIGDHNHISHRFVKMGLSRKRAVQLVHLMALAIGLGSFPILWGSFGTAAILVCQTILLLLIISILQFSLAHQEENPKK